MSFYCSAGVFSACVSLDFSICTAMTATGQQMEVSTNEISGKTSLHGLTVFHFSNVAILSGKEKKDLSGN